MFTFTDDCLLGVEALDNEHRHLFDLLNQGIDILNNEYKDDKYSDIKELLEELEDYADQHFTHEEAYMESICDSELILQRPQHMIFRERIMDFFMHNIDDVDQQEEVLEDLVHFLAKWLYHHIIGSDTLIGKLPPLEEWMIRENPCEFVEEYQTGIDMIDREHTALFKTIEHAHKLVRAWNEDTGYGDIMQALEKLKGYTKDHFADEEEYMRAIGYEGYEVHKRSHQAFLSELSHINPEEVGGNSQEYMESLIIYLIGWMANHITELDKKIPKESEV